MNSITVSERFNRRAKFALIGILLVAALAHLGKALVWNPIQVRHDQIQKLGLEREQIRQVQERAGQASIYSKEMKAQSLSSDPLVTAHRYHEWLLKLAAQVDGVTVAPLPTVNLGTIGHAVAFQLEGTCDLEWLAGFIERVEHTPLLHRISYLSIDHEVGNTVQFSCKLEALAAADAETMTTWPAPDASPEQAALSSFLAQHRPFERGYRGPEAIEETMVAKLEPEPESIVTTEAIDPFETLKLVGAIKHQGQPQIWLYDGRTNQEIFAPENGQFTFAAKQFEVKKISPDFVLLDHANSIIRWP